MDQILLLRLFSCSANCNLRFYIAFSECCFYNIFSISSMVTGNSFIPSTHDPSQGAGQILPVNSGKLLVVESISYAFFHWLLYTASLNSGITFPNGQPLWQKVFRNSCNGLPDYLTIRQMASAGTPDNVSPCFLPVLSPVILYHILKIRLSFPWLLISFFVFFLL